MELKKILSLPVSATNNYMVKNFFLNPFLLNNQQPIVSFTFDDFPESAYTIGGTILERHGAKGTFYTSFGLLNITNHLGKHFNKEDVEKLILAGHEIGSHTFSHISCQTTNKSKLIIDLDRNQEAAREISDKAKMENFSYPFGEVNIPAKRLMSSKFKSSRSIFPGINKGSFDLNLLKANKLYYSTSIKNIHELILENAKNKGWLIFYTHDVRKNPSKFGCSPELFEQTVNMVLKSGSKILTIREVLNT